MESNIRSVGISSYLRPKEYSHRTDVSVWRYGDENESDDMRDRFTISINAGPTTMYLRPTLDEARELIEALQWAIEPAGATA